MQEISSASAVQVDSVKTLNHAITELDGVAQTNVGTADQTAAAVCELRQQTHDAEALVQHIFTTLCGTMPQSDYSSTTTTSDAQTEKNFLAVSNLRSNSARQGELAAAR